MGRWRRSPTLVAEARGAPRSKEPGFGDRLLNAYVPMALPSHPPSVPTPPSALMSPGGVRFDRSQRGDRHAIRFDTKGHRSLVDRTLLRWGRAGLGVGERH